MFFTRRSLRTLAAQVLALWLFGIAAGVANQCLAASASAEARHAASHAAALAAASIEVAGDVAEVKPAHIHPGTADGTSPVAAVDNPNCLDFCDKVTVSVPVVKANAADQPPPALIADPLQRDAATGIRPVAIGAPRPIGSLDPPSRVVFSRLAL